MIILVKNLELFTIEFEKILEEKEDKYVLVKTNKYTDVYYGNLKYRFVDDKEKFYIKELEHLLNPFYEFSSLLFKTNNQYEQKEKTGYKKLTKKDYKKTPKTNTKGK